MLAMFLQRPQDEFALGHGADQTFRVVRVFRGKGKAIDNVDASQHFTLGVCVGL